MTTSPPTIRGRADRSLPSRRPSAVTFLDETFPKPDGGLPAKAKQAYQWAVGLDPEHGSRCSVEGAARFLYGVRFRVDTCGYHYGKGLIHEFTNVFTAWFSEDDGNNWTNRSSGLPDNVLTSALAISDSGQILLVGTDDGQLFRSTDNALHWQSVDSEFPQRRIELITFSAGRSIYLAVNNSGIYRSKDNAKSWHSLNEGLMGEQIRDIAYHNDGYIVAVTPAAIYRIKDNEDVWTELLNGTVNGPIDVVAVNDSNKVFVGTNLGLFGSKDIEKDSWEKFNNLSGYPIQSIAFNDSGHVWVGAKNGGLFQSINNGSTWEQIVYNFEIDGIKAIAFNDSGHIFAGFFPGSNGILRSKDNGQSWEKILRYNVMSITFNAKGDIFAGSFPSGMFRSTDNGTNWSRINEGLSSTLVQDVAIDNSGHIFVATQGGLFRSTDNGNSWKNISNGIFTPYVRSLTINKSGHIFVGTSGDGVYRSIDNAGGS